MLFQTAYADDAIMSGTSVQSQDSTAVVIDDTVTVLADADIKSTLINSENNIIEAEDVTPLSATYIKTNDYASNGKVVRYALTDRTEYVETFYIEAAEAGEYSFEISAANIISGVWLSGMYISVNGEAEIEMNKNNFEVTVPDVPENAFLSKSYPVNYFKYKKKLTLNEGMNTMVVRFTERSLNDGGKVHAVIDCIKLRKERAIDGLTVELEKSAISIGETTGFIMKNGAGEAVTASDAESFNIEFDSFGIAEVSGTAIKGLNNGTTGFTVTAVKGDVTETVKGTITVIGTSGLWIENAQRNGETVSFDVKTLSDYTGSDNIIIAVYGKEEGGLTSIKAAVPITLESFTASGSFSVSEEIDGLGNDDVVQIFIFSSTRAMRTICGKIVL